MCPPAPAEVALSPLARRLVDELHRRRLAPGDRFLTAAEVGSRFGVSPATANRALQLLHRGGLLERRPRRGTFVAPGFQARGGGAPSVLMLFVPRSRRDRLTAEISELTDSLLDRFEGVSVQLCPVPEEGAEAAVRESIRAVGRGCAVLGAAAMSCPAGVYRALSESGLPAVVFGGLYPGQGELVAVDSDLGAAGEILGRHLIERGHRRLALLQGTDVRPGDDRFLNGAVEALARHGLPANALRVLYVAPDAGSIAARLGELLADPQPPTGLVLNGLVLAERVLAALRRLGAKGDDGIEVVFYAHASPRLEAIPLVHARSAVERRQMHEIGVEALWRQHRGQSVERGERIVPVVLHDPREEAAS